MKRRLFNLAAAMSLVLCVATVAQWVRSYIVSDVFIDGDSRDVVWATTGRGQLRIIHDWSPGLNFDNDRQYGQYPPHGDLEGLRSPNWTGNGFSLLGFGVETGEMWYTLFLPFWLISLCLLVLPLWFARRVYVRARARRLGEHRCDHCGYDLRATPDRCPECGTQAKSQPAKGARGLFNPGLMKRKHH